MTIEKIRQAIHDTALRVIKSAGTGDGWQGRNTLNRQVDHLRFLSEDLSRQVDRLSDAIDEEYNHG